MIFRVLFKYLWTSPTTAVGLLFLPLAVLTGGGAQIVRGVLEVHGGGVRWLLRHAPGLVSGAMALTLGHVILGLDRGVLAIARDHEHVHVRQCERWGVFFVPAYLLASLRVLTRGGKAYRDNPFEQEARVSTLKLAPKSLFRGPARLEFGQQE